MRRAGIEASAPSAGNVLALSIMRLCRGASETVPCGETPAAERQRWFGGVKTLIAASVRMLAGGRRGECW